jgi:hypothetical protein
MTTDQALDHLRIILRANEADPAQLIRNVEQRVLGEVTAHGRTYDGGALGLLVEAFIVTIRDTIKNAIEEVNRIFSLPGMPLDEDTEAAVKGCVWGEAATFIGYAEQSLQRLAANHPHVPRPPQLAGAVEPWKGVCYSEIALFFHGARVANQTQLVLRSGQLFDANVAVRQLFESATKSIEIADPYIGLRLLRLLAAKQPSAMIRILSSDIRPADRQAVEDFRKQYGQIELRRQKDGMHDRFVIIDGIAAYTVGHSLKDLGSKDTVITRTVNSHQIIELFSERWNSAEAVI